MSPVKTSKSPRQVVPIILERLSLASESRPLCIKCSLHESCDAPFRQPIVPEDWTGKFLFITEPRVKGEPFVAAMKAAGIRKNDVAWVPVLRCKPLKTARMSQVRSCAPFLYRAIEVLKPKHILGLGKDAARALSNNGNPGLVPLLRGRELVCKYGEDNSKSFPYHITSGLSDIQTKPHESARFSEDTARYGWTSEAYPAKGVPKVGTGSFGFDTEYTPTDTLCGAVSSRDLAITASAQDLGRLASTISKGIIVGHNLPVDLDALLKAKTPGLDKPMEEWLKGNRQRDTLLLAKLVDENRGKGAYKLESLLLSYYQVKDYKAPTELLGPDPTLWPVGLRDERCRLDAWSTLKVYDALAPLALGPQQINHRIAMTLHRMKYIGVYISMETFQKLKTDIYAEEASASLALSQCAKENGLPDFSASKDNDVRRLVYEKLGLKIESYTKGGLPSASVKVLKEYKDDFPEIQALLAYSKADKLKTTYCDGLEKKIERLKDGRHFIPVRIGALAAKTGRRSSSGPNLQNWPTRIRKIIVSRFKQGVIADNDYSKLEPIAGGWVTGEHKLTEYFTKYANGYIKIGEDFFKKTVEKNTPQYTAVKSLVLAILYNKKRWSLAEDLWVNHGVKLDSNYEKHTEEAGKILDKFLDLFPGVRAYHRRQEDHVLKHGYVDNALGQRRRLPMPPEPQRSDKIAYKIWMKYKAHVINQAINYPIQGFASYITGCAMVDLEEAFLRQFKWSYRDFHLAIMAKEWPNMPLICIEVHDDIVLDIPAGMADRTKALTHEIMRRPPSLARLVPDFNIPLSVDTNTGANWGAKT